MRTKYALLAIVAGVPLGLITGALLADEDGIATATVTAIATGIVTGGITSAYVWWRDRAWLKWAAKVRERYAAEGVIHDGQARLGVSVGLELAAAMTRMSRAVERGSDGWLVLTKQRLVFQPRFGDGRIELAAEEIAGARRGDALLPNTIALKLRDQRSFELRVQRRDEWLDKLSSVPGITVIRRA